MTITILFLFSVSSYDAPLALRRSRKSFREEIFRHGVSPGEPRPRAQHRALPGGDVRAQSHRRGRIPVATPKQNDPMKESPAPVVSTTCSARMAAAGANVRARDRASTVSSSPASERYTVADVAGAAGRGTAAPSPSVAPSVSFGFFAFASASSDAAERRAGLLASSQSFTPRHHHRAAFPSVVTSVFARSSSGEHRDHRRLGVLLAGGVARVPRARARGRPCARSSGRLSLSPLALHEHGDAPLARLEGHLDGHLREAPVEVRQRGATSTARRRASNSARETRARGVDARARRAARSTMM